MTPESHFSAFGWAFAAGTALFDWVLVQDVFLTPAGNQQREVP